MSGVAENKFCFVILFAKLHCQAMNITCFFILAFERLKAEMARYEGTKVARSFIFGVVKIYLGEFQLPS
jgi:hypothetical protein